MDVQDFIGEPTKKRHPSYENSLFSSVAPEYATGEVLLGSAYRMLLLNMRDSEVGLDRVGDIPAEVPSSFGGQDLWTELLLRPGGIESPLRGGQYGSVLSRQLMPLVPAVARTACVLGKKPRSRWYPANLLIEVIGAGAGEVEGTNLMRQVGDKLRIDQDDDLFARFVSLGLDAVFPPAPPTAPYQTLSLGPDQLHAYRGSTKTECSPAERFCRDLRAVLDLKHQLTRRQWTVLVEAILRLGLGMHTLWVCQVNSLAWSAVLDAADGKAVPGDAEVEALVWDAHRESHPLLEVGQNAEPLLKRLIERYAYARIGLNLLFCRLEEAGASFPIQTIGYSTHGGTTAAQSVRAFLQHVFANRARIDAVNATGWLRSQCSDLVDGRSSLRELTKCDAGFTKNLFEFARHSLGQIKAKDVEQKSYDQSYLIAYPGERKPLPVQPGPAMLILLVYACCKAQGNIPASLDDLRRHLADYGLKTPAGELSDGKVGADLEKLGLVVDSPDAAGGRMLVAPF